MKETWTTHKIVVPEHCGFLLSIAQSMMTLEQFGEFAAVLEEAALAYLRKHDLIIEVKAPAQPDNVVAVDFQNKRRT